MYGYDPDVGRVALTYVAATPALRCVDDPQSTHYNRIVSTSSVTPDWGSAERMLRSDDLYELAILVSHNQGQPKPGAGSCIFLHVWGGPDVPVRGCTAMAKPALERLSRWLEPTAVLVALPEGEYGALSGRWELPP